MLLGSIRAHRTISVAVAALLLTATAGALPAGASPSNDLASQQAKAKALEAQIDADNQRIEILDEQFNEAGAAIAAATARIAAGQAQLEQSEANAAAMRHRLAARAARLYMGAGAPDALPALDTKTVADLAARAKYSEAAASHDSHLLDDVKLAQENLGRERADLERQRAAAAAKEKSLGAARRQVAQAVAQQQHVLSQVKGNIATLVTNIQNQKRAADEARARASMNTSTRSFGGSLGGGSDLSLPAPPPSGGAATAVAVAEAQLGKPYVYAGAGPDVYDCSGLTMYAWGKAGVSMAHSATLQYTSFPHVSISQLQPGDLLVFGHPIHHVGMYVGNGTMIEAPHTGANVRFSSIYRSDFVGASRP